MPRDDPDDLDTSVVEAQVEQIWKDVLGARDGQEGLTFFDLQGQSISAVRIVARIEDELGIGIDVAIMFNDPNLECLVREVITAARGGRRTGQDLNRVYDRGV